MKSFLPSNLRALRVLATLAAITFSQPASAILDTNNNLLSDLWEKQHNNGNLFPPTILAENDEDLDGWTNAQEAAAGTDPFDPNPPDGIVAVTLTPSLPPGAFTLTWPTLVGKNYQLKVSTDLLTWTNLGDPITTTQTTHTIGINTSQPDTTIPPKVFWRVVVSDLDTDGDGLTDAEELALGLNPNQPNTIAGLPDLWVATHFLNHLLNSGIGEISADDDLDTDGLSNAIEAQKNTNPKSADNDGDGLNDNEDADPNDSLIIWPPSNSSKYILIEISELNDYYAYDLNDKGEVLFPEKLWKPGSVTNLPSPTFSGPAKEPNETYDSSHDYWLFINNHGRLAGIGNAGIPEPYHEDFYQDTIFVHDSSAPQSNFDFAKNIPMWDYGNLTLFPIGITDAGEVVSDFTYYTYDDPSQTYLTEEKKLVIFNPAGTAFSYLPLPPDYESTFSSGFPNPRVTPGGWIATLTKATSLSTGAPYKLALWNPSRQLVALPAQANGQYDRMSITELPNQKVGLIGVLENALTNTITSQVFLPDSNGTMRHSEKLSGKNLIVFAGNGTALGHDGQLWRNGKLIPMRDICEQWSAYEGEYAFHPIKGNKHGTYLIQAIKPDPINQTPVTKHLIAVKADLDFIKPGTENDTPKIEIDEENEDSEGEVVNINWDDDDDSEGDGGHGKLVFKNDFDDTEPNEEEDDMIQLKLHAFNATGAKAKLKYDANFVKIWRNRNRTGEVVSESTEIAVTETQIVYLEGRKLTPAEVPTIVEMLIKTDGNENYKSGDKVSVHVATPVITFQGKLWKLGGGYASKNIALQLHDKNYLGKNRREDRNNTVILNGKNQQGKMLWYSVDMVDISPSEVGHPKNKRPLIKIRAPSLDKEMKMAHSLEGAHVFYNGHSNFGLGPNFNKGGTSTVDDYMNLSGRGMTAIIVKSDDSDDPNPMADLDHGGPNFALRPADIPSPVTNYTVPVSGVLKFTGPALGAVLTKKIHADGTPYHYERQSEHNNWITIVNSSGDVPTLRYASCFMASCNTGRHFPETLNHGVLLFSIDETYSVLGGSDGILEEDLTSDGYSWGITHYVRLLTEGKSWTEIVTFFNQNQYF